MKPTEPGHGDYRPDIDGLRALAILSVVGFHAFPAWMPGGFTGVDIFFVISGFLISGILLNNLRDNKFSLAGFYARRVRRIFPALIAVLIAVLGAGYFILWLGEYKQLGKHVAGGAGFVVNYLLAGEAGYFDAQAATKPLLHLWSLGVEEQFYFFWPLLLWLGWKARRHAGWIITALLALSFGTDIYLSQTAATMDFYSILSRFWELLAGGALAYACGTRNLAPSRAVAESLSVVGLALIAAADVALSNKMLFPGWLALLPVLGAVCLIAAGQRACVNRWFLANPVMIGVGLISYPLYLWHWPLLSFATILWGEEAPRDIRIAMIVLSFALAYVTYALIEKPLRAGPLRRKTVAALLAAMMLIAATGIGIYADGGVPQRFADGGAREEKLDSTVLITQWKQDIRGDICHLGDAPGLVRAPQCIEAKHPLLLLWGDSHAAALYPGLAALQKKYPFGIAQLTQADCPPLFGMRDPSNRPGCGKINDEILNQAAQLKPQVILLQAAWTRDDYGLEQDQIIERVIATTDLIHRQVPGAKIIVTGASPQWLSPLPAIYRRALTFGNAMPAPYTWDHLDAELRPLEQIMPRKMADAGIAYLSLQAQLCNAQGCLTRTGADSDSIAFVDSEHMTAEVSRRVAGGLAPDLLKALGLQP